MPEQRIILPLTQSLVTSICTARCRGFLLMTGISRRRLMHSQVMDHVLTFASGYPQIEEEAVSLALRLALPSRCRSVFFERLDDPSAQPLSLRELPWHRLLQPLLAAFQYALLPYRTIVVRRRTHADVRVARSLAALRAGNAELSRIIDRLRSDIDVLTEITTSWSVLMAGWQLTAQKIFGKHLSASALAYRSVEDLREAEMKRLVWYFKADAPLWHAVLQKDREAFMARAHETRNAQVYERYVDAFGGCDGGDLLLEREDNETDFALFCDALRAYDRSDAAATQGDPPREAHPLQRFFLARFRQEARRREKLELLLQNAVGALRIAYRRQGEQLARSGKLSQTLDIFSLSRHEAASLAGGSALDARELVEKRRRSALRTRISDAPVSLEEVAA